jgi:hypothetical protein
MNIFSFLGCVKEVGSIARPVKLVCGRKMFWFVSLVEIINITLSTIWTFEHFVFSKHLRNLVMEVNCMKEL